MFFRTDNPVRDAEEYQNQDPYIHCGECGESIYIGDSTHYPDDFYRIEGVTMCKECAEDWLEQRKASCL